MALPIEPPTLLVPVTGLRASERAPPVSALPALEAGEVTGPLRPPPASRYV